MAFLYGLTFLYYWWATGSLISSSRWCSFPRGCIVLFRRSGRLYCWRCWVFQLSCIRNDDCYAYCSPLHWFGSWVISSSALGTEELMLATLLIAAIVASSAAIAGDVMQDLKTGHMVGATPWRQQTAEIIGVVTGAVDHWSNSAAPPQCIPDFKDSVRNESSTWRPYLFKCVIRSSG